MKQGLTWSMARRVWQAVGCDAGQVRCWLSGILFKGIDTPKPETGSTLRYAKKLVDSLPSRSADIGGPEEGKLRIGGNFGGENSDSGAELLSLDSTVAATSENQMRKKNNKNTHQNQKGNETHARVLG